MSGTSQVRLAVFLAASAAFCNGAVIAPGYSSSYSVFDLGSISGLPARYGGLTFVPGDTSRILIGGAANGASGLFYSVPVVRDASNHITGFGTPTAQGYGAYNDGGIAFGPGGVLFYSRWPVNELGQVEPGSNADDKVIALGALGVVSSHAALGFVPAGYNGAGGFKMLSWSGGQFYDVALAADGSGTYNVLSATLVTTLPGGPEGFIWVPQGSPLFPSQSMLVSDYSANRVSAYQIDASGNPIVGTRADFVTGLTGAEGAAIDPLTGDFLFSTFGGGDRVYRVQGFAAPPSPGTGGEIPEPSTLGAMLIGLGMLAALRRR